MDATRDLAFRLIKAVLGQHRPLDEALDKLPQAEPRDRSAAHLLAATVLRRAGTLEAVLEPHLRRAPPPEAIWILWIGAASLLFLGTPPHAAVGTAVELMRARKLAPFAGLANAVLRRVAERGAAVLDELDSPRLDTPPWLWASWGERARAIARAHQHEAPLDLTLKPGAAPPAGGEVLPTGSVRFPAGTRVSDLAGFAEGDWWVQDAAAALPVRLLAPHPGERVADLCAAPGGKTAQLAAAGAHVTAVDNSAKRGGRLRENLRRLGLDADIAEADAAEWTPSELFDAVLLDAPCSATGTIRRHPDLPHLKRPDDVVALAAQQDRLIEAAGRLLRPGGRLIYAVCSLQAEEGRAKVLDRFGLACAPFSKSEASILPEAFADGSLRTCPALWPERSGMDGFFITRFVKL
jgi:16S rRNA (cytosine967-C5)-methyltransferase